MKPVHKPKQSKLRIWRKHMISTFNLAKIFNVSPNAIRIWYSRGILIHSDNPLVELLSIINRMKNKGLLDNNVLLAVDSYPVNPLDIK